jgi:hypothetical protein
MGGSEQEDVGEGTGANTIGDVSPEECGRPEGPGKEHEGQNESAEVWRNRE